MKTLKYRLENQDRIEQYYLENRDKIIAQKKIYFNNKNKRDTNFLLIKNTRIRMYNSLKGKTKSSSTIEILGIDIDIFEKLD